MAVGTGTALKAELSDMTVAHFKEVLQFWTLSPVYLRAIAAGIEHRNLDGTAAEGGAAEGEGPAHGHAR